MAEESELTVTINAQDAGATAQVSGVNDLLVQMEADLAKLNVTGAATLEALTAGHTAAARAAGEHAVAEDLFGASIGKVEGATNAAARAASALGLNVAEAAERVNVFGEALDGLGAAAGPLLAVGAAMLVIAEAANFVKDGIEGAATAESYMQTLGETVQRQGGNWDQAKEGVERFLDAMEGATVYSREETLKALNDLTSAGMSLADAEKTVAISADVASGTHRSLTDVVDRLKEAEAGRGLGLVELDGNLKTLVHSHADYSQILEQLTRDFQGDAAAALDTYQGKTAQLRNELDHFAEELGEKFLPYLEEGTEILIGLAEEAESHTPQIAHFFTELINDARTALGVLQDIETAFDAVNGKMIADAITGTNVEGDLNRLNNLTNHVADFAGTFGGQNDYVNPPPGEQSSGGDFMRGMSQIVANAQQRAAATRAAATRDFNTAETQPLQHDFQVGNTPAGGGGPTPVEPITDDAVDKTQDYEVALKAVDAYIKTITDSEKGFSEAVKLATDETTKNNAEMALAQKISADAKQEVALYTGEIANENHELTAAQAAHDKAKAAMDASREAYNAYGASLGEGTKRSEEERASLERLKKEHDEAKTKFEESQRAIDGLTSAITSNTSKLDEARDKTHAYAEAQAALIESYNTSTQADQQKIADEQATYGKSLEAQRAYWQEQIAADKAGYADGTYSEKEYYANKLSDEQKYREASEKLVEDDQATAKKRADLNQQLADEAATYDLSIQQQIRYYAERYALLEAGDSNARAEAEKYYEQIVKLEDDEFKQRLDAEKKFVADAQDAETKLLDDIITKHESFHEVLHTIFQEVGDDFIKMVERMLVEAPLLQTMEKSLFNILNPGSGGGSGSLFGGGVGGSGSGPATQGASLFGAFGGLFGETGATNVISQLDTSSFTSTMLGTNTAQQIANNATSPTSNGSFDPTNPLGIGGSPTSDYSGFPSGPGGGGGFSLGSTLSGAAIGTTIASVTGGNQTYGALGGAILGTVGSAFGGPIGGTIGDVVGGLVGSLFGSHANPTQDPDMYEGQTGFGQNLADLRGTQAGASGTDYWVSSAVAKFIAAMGVGAGTINGVGGAGQQMMTPGGVASSGGVDAVEMWLAQNKSDTQQQLLQMGISPAQFAQWESLFGVSATGSGQLVQDGTNVNDVEVTGATSGGGKQTTVSALAAALNTIISAGGASSTPVYSMTEAYPGAPSVLSSSPLGYYNSTTGAYTPASTAGASGASAAPGTTGSITPTVVVNINGNQIVGAAGLDTVVNEITAALKNAASGQVPGARTNTRAARYGLK